VEDARHDALRNAAAGYKRRKRPSLFGIAADAWLKAKRGTGDWSPKMAIIEETNLKHLKPVFGNDLLTDITHQDVARYWEQRANAKKPGSPKTISLELGTLRAILLYYDLDSQWAAIRKKVQLKKARKIGRAITLDEESTLLSECRNSRSRSLPVAVTLALQTGMRYSELRLLRWRQVDFAREMITVGKSKSDAGTGREIPLITVPYECLKLWAGNFPNRKLNHDVFPAEKYGAKGEEDSFGFTAGVVIYDTDPTQPIGTWKEAWEAAKKRAGVECRYHDLRHTACTHLLEAGASINDLADIMGWSTSTAIRMVREVYGHTTLAARRRTMQQLEKYLASRLRGAQKGAQLEMSENGRIQ